jgi:hypothetical protein
MRDGLLRRKKTAIKEVFKEELPDGYGQNLKGMRLIATDELVLRDN